MSTSARGCAQAEAQGRSDGLAPENRHAPRTGRSSPRGFLFLQHSLVKLQSEALGIKRKDGRRSLPAFPIELFLLTVQLFAFDSVIARSRCGPLLNEKSFIH